ncbi:geranylgeranyl diphosphate reductase [Aurantiacibacter spongiae]|uniref:geranylgeranyl diphosphate reductase n=1 Tax=Aurantiacibacter spongiae TaxID=2488860 RepID=A0A3N5DAQ1_9SPHN|nr:geranylgeranyl diphosphate reductase [Aurantiacibacter spongiae]RPF71778.1 geranylgeranyl diphosphate reductase [Aurantiacibacter spongiae]
MTDTSAAPQFDVVVVGGGPSGATAAHTLAQAGIAVMLLDRADCIKPCGGAIPPRAIDDFAIPESQLCARILAARAVAPSGRAVTMDISDSLPDGYVGMVDRARFDPWLRRRAAAVGAELREGRFRTLQRLPDGGYRLEYQPRDGNRVAVVRARIVIGADGANSQVARQALPGQKGRHVFAYHEIVARPAAPSPALAETCCDVIYRGDLSPDFYSWIFPHGDTISIGTGTARKGFALREAVAQLRRELSLTGSDGVRTVRREGAPIPMKPLKRWEDGHGVLLVGDAAGVVAPASGEGIYYAMRCGELGAQAAARAVASGELRHLAEVRRAFLAEHGKVFRALGLLQACWYRTDWLRERFVALCRDRDVQRLTWIAYTEKRMMKAQHGAHLRLMATNIANLAPGWLSAIVSRQMRSSGPISARR